MSGNTTMRGYNERGFASVLDGVADLITRAAKLFRDLNNTQTPPAVKAAYRREITACLAETEELIAALRKEASL